MKPLSETDILAQLNREIARAGTIAAWAAQHGISPSYVGDVLKGRRHPGEAVIEALGLQRIVVPKV